MASGDAGKNMNSKKKAEANESPMNEAEKWINRAESDWSDGNFNLKANKINVAVFLFQQSAEKALKSLQIKELERFERAHNLIELAKSVDAPKNIIDAAEKINPVYTITRYPDVEEGIEPDDAAAISNLSKKVVEWAKARIKKS
ncbi:MAG: HEPN domain-containing protein [Candidatus Aenigmarchaeota archaeon]|nr:HEPN domain-containing protein [Candidatus Aenigmarchaeota archaeon]OIN85802.1 MAG: hypothetical protein AUJ50_04620 [Candidatus Aenigmarchaeota archaeon CG1_02_38_14]PIV69501.1 MAG: hypothetical protein COS07_00495 [Candidatus Aenigmarchaeota archaeon CG01_land_8_20_14_3_00_37_9]PIW41783.1 MAG: hypothetical protein COW21_00090 [Candidatus Aenigmarchaeota archaeon CG15_BIG_FIL_POST_REV_8_21_14_020_37_27]PIX50732.1 MAG: hypothetical protein COZ52_02565 [Candidatus Aenigmarchaeota archaeon CG_